MPGGGAASSLHSRGFFKVQGRAAEGGKQAGRSHSVGLGPGGSPAPGQCPQQRQAAVPWQGTEKLPAVTAILLHCGRRPLQPRLQCPGPVRQRRMRLPLWPDLLQWRVCATKRQREAGGLACRVCTCYPPRPYKLLLDPRATLALSDSLIDRSPPLLMQLDSIAPTPSLSHPYKALPPMWRCSLAGQLRLLRQQLPFAPDLRRLRHQRRVPVPAR